MAEIITTKLPGSDAIQCPSCGTLVPPSVLSCPGCRRLMHSDKLKELATQAGQLSAAGDVEGELATWREAMNLLPPGTRQFETIASKVGLLSEQQARSPQSLSRPPGKPAHGKGFWAKAGTSGGLAALMLWKFKFIAVFLLTKAKLLLLGLTKMSTFTSMLLSLGVYWTVWGWKFALGLVLSIYVHEMGHVAMLRRFGVKASAPMFIPGLGAVVRLQQHFSNPREDARVGLAGPIWGLGAAAVSLAVFYATGLPIWGAIAKVGAWINLFNLLPIWQLDGGRAFHSLTKTHRWIAAACVGVVWVITHEPLLLFILVVAVFRAFGEAAKQRDDTALYQYCSLIIVLSMMTLLHVPTPLG